MTRSNILLITDDQHRWDFYDNRTVPSLRTPHLTRLMAEGATFTHAYSNCPICMPTRFTWCHGLYASQADARFARNAADWPTDLPTMPQSLQRAGYRTALIGKLHSVAGLYHCDLLADKLEETRARGFDHVVETSGKSLSNWFECAWTRRLAERGVLDAYRADIRDRGELTGGLGRCDASVLPREEHMDGFTADRACDHLRDQPHDAPWFCHVSFCGPHFPLDPPADLLEHYRPDDMPPPEGVDDPEAIALWRRRRAAYCAIIEHVDEQIGRVLHALDRRADAGRTVVLFATDHGDMMGHRGFGHKGKPYDTSARTPYVIRHRGVVPSGVFREHPFEAVDLPITIMDLAGVGEAEAHLPGTPGRSFLAAARGDDAPGAARTHAYSEGNGWRMVCDERWKLIVRADGGDELYDRRTDPWELANRIDDPAEAPRVQRMQRWLIASTLGAWARRGRSEPPPRDDWWM